MATTTARIILDSAQAQASLDKLSAGIDRTNKLFGSMKSQLMGLGFAALAKSAIAAADEIKDLSDASGVAVGTLMELRNALSQVGGESKDMAKFVTTFSKSIEEAADGSLAAQNSFNKLGITIEDFQKLSEKDMMLKTLDGIAKLKTQTEQTAAMMDKFGKSARTVSAAGLAEEMRNTAGEGSKFAVSIARAAELNDKFAKTADNIKFALLEAFSPAMDKLNAFIGKVMEGKDSMDLLIGAIKLAGIAFASWTILTTMRSVVSVIGSVGRGVGVLAGLFAPAAIAAEKVSKSIKGISEAAAASAASTKALAAAGTTAGSSFGESAGKFAKWSEEAFAATGKTAKFLPSLRALTAVFASGFGIYAATQLFDDFGDVAGNALARVIELVGSLAGVLAGGAIGAGIGSAFGPIGTILGGLAGSFGGDKLFEALGFGKLIEKAKESRLETEKLAKATKDLQENKGKDANKGDQPLGATVDTTTIDNMRKAVEEASASYARMNKKIVDQVNLDSDLIGKSKETADQMRAINELHQRTADEVQKLMDAKEKMSKVDREAGMGATYDAQIEKIKELGAAEESRIKAAISNNNKLQAAEQLRLFSISQSVALEAQLKALNVEKANVFLPEITKQYNNIKAAADAAAAAQIAAEETRTGKKLSAEEVSAYYAAAKKGVDELIVSTTALNIEQNKFQLHLYGIQQEIDLSNSLNKIQDDMAKMTMPEIEQKYYDIASAARDSAKAAIEAEEARRGAKLDPTEAQAYYDRASAGIGKLTAATKKQWEMSRSFETGWKKAMNSYIDEATNAATKSEKLFTTAFKGMEDAIVGFAKTGKFEWKSFVSDMLEQLLRSQIQDVFANLLTSITASMSNATASSQANGSADSGIMGMLGGLFGGGSSGSSAGGLGSSKGTPVYVTNWQGAGGLSSALGGTGAAASSGGGIMDTIAGWFGGGSLGEAQKMTSQMDFGYDQSSPVASSDSSWLGSVASSVGDIASSIGDWFSGMFATGGTIPAGKIGIVGERGPEFIGGPANITPMSAAGTGAGQSTTVNYNIYANDAKSFQQMVAADPAFIHAVVMQGSKGMAA